MAWHDATCAALELEWEYGRPGCLTCQRKAPALSPVHPISPPGPPPDVPRSQLVCTWPPQLFPDDLSVKLYQDKEARHVDAKCKDQSHITPTVLRVAKTSKRICPTKPPNLSSIQNEEDALSPADNSEDADAARHDLANRDQNIEMLAFIRANIDEWTSSNFAQPPMTLDSTQQCPQEPRNLPSLTPSFQDIYTSLPNADSVRLLRLHGSAAEDDPVHCTLLVCGLRDPSRPTFEAFSYTWADAKGDSSLSEAIYVGPQYDILPVTKNCLAALQCFRTNVDRLVWVDAVCINQFDLEERGHQVSLMRDVYTSAARVLTYLGNYDETLENLSESSQCEPTSSGNYYKPSAANISAILRLPYFSRIWVIQEVLLSQTATLTVGKHTLSWQDFRELAQQSLPDQERKPALINNPYSSSEDLVRWLKVTKDCRCGDLRDRVYGLLGLTDRKVRMDLPVDYSISKQQLYIGLAMYWLTREHAYMGLVSAVLDMALLPKVTPFLPSWTPDWTPWSNTEADRAFLPSTPLTLWLDTTSLGAPCSGLDWDILSGVHGNNGINVRWTLDKFIRWHELTRYTRSYADDTSLFSRGPDWVGGWEPLDLVKPIPLGGTLALRAVHMFSVSMGKRQLLDHKGQPLHALHIIHSGHSETKNDQLSHRNIHLHVALGWRKLLALRRHADAVYSLHNRFQIICAPLGEPEPSGRSTQDPGNVLKKLLKRTTECWLRDVFFYGVCAGSAYTSRFGELGVRTQWSETLPQASVACQVLNFRFENHAVEAYRLAMIAMMIEISEDARNVVHETENPWETPCFREHNNPRTQSKQFRENFWLTDTMDEAFASCISMAHESKSRATFSPEEICTYLRSVVSRCRHTCDDYSPLQSTLYDITEISHEVFECSDLALHIWESLVHMTAVFDTRYAKSWRDVAPSITRIIYIGYKLMQNLKIDIEFSLGQNLDILWIHVLTMEMVARLRGCLQQWLVRKAVQDSMKRQEEIYLI